MVNVEIKAALVTDKIVLALNPQKMIHCDSRKQPTPFADEVIAHLAGLVGSRVKVTAEIEPELPTGAPGNVVRIVTENSRTLKFVSQGFERE